MAVTTDPIVERRRLLAEIRDARIAGDVARSNWAESGRRKKRFAALRFQAEMDAARGIASAEESVERTAKEEQSAAADEVRFARAMEAAAAVIKTAEAQLATLYRDGFSGFAQEADELAQVAVEKAEHVRHALREYQRAWVEAEACWTRLQLALVERIEALDAEEGRSRDRSTVVRESLCPPYPIQTSDELLARPPRPPAMERLAGPNT